MGDIQPSEITFLRSNTMCTVEKAGFEAEKTINLDNFEPDITQSGNTCFDSTIHPQYNDATWFTVFDPLQTHINVKEIRILVRSDGTSLIEGAQINVEGSIPYFHTVSGAVAG